MTIMKTMTRAEIVITAGKSAPASICRGYNSETSVPRHCKVISPSKSHLWDGRKLSAFATLLFQAIRSNGKGILRVLISFRPQKDFALGLFCKRFRRVDVHLQE
jgi:hypothetical protein